MIAFCNVMLVQRQLNSSVMRWFNEEVAVCVAGVEQCGSLKVRKYANPRGFSVAKASAARVRHGFGAGAARDPSNSGHIAFL